MLKKSIDVLDPERILNRVKKHFFETLTKIDLFYCFYTILKTKKKSKNYTIPLFGIFFKKIIDFFPICLLI